MDDQHIPQFNTDTPLPPCPTPWTTTTTTTAPTVAKDQVKIDDDEVESLQGSQPTINNPPQSKFMCSICDWLADRWGDVVNHAEKRHFNTVFFVYKLSHEAAEGINAAQMKKRGMDTKVTNHLDSKHRDQRSSYQLRSYPAGHLRRENEPATEDRDDDWTLTVVDSMPSPKSRSRSWSRSPSRSSSKRHKKSQKRSKRRSAIRSPPPLQPSLRRDEGSNGTGPNEGEAAKTPPAEQSLSQIDGANNAQTTKKRKRRWGDDETDKVFLPHASTTISATAMSDQEQKLYLLKLQVEELTRRLKVNDWGIPANVGERSASPQPSYDLQDKRQNIRQVRRKIEDQRHQLVTEILALSPQYKPPADYRPQLVEFSAKVLIPQEDYPELNFVGLIIGPRGSTLKTLEEETGAKIIIRGKGSLKDGKIGLVKHGPTPGDDEPLHAYVTGPTTASIAEAAEKVQEIIHQSIDTPEGLIKLRKQQLRQLTLLNGTVRENDSLIKLEVVDEAERRNLVIGAKTSGPTLAIAGGSSSVPDVQPSTTTVGSVSFNTNASNRTETNPPSLMWLRANPSHASSTTSSSSDYSNSQSTSSNYLSAAFSTTGPRYNNNDVFDGYHLPRRHNRRNN